MASKIIETTHDYEPVNKYIDEKARIKRTRSVWGYTRSLALFLIAFGIFLILAAFAYHIFKKPHSFQQNQISEQHREILNEELIKKNNQIQKLESNKAQLESTIGQLKEDLQNNPENEQLKQRLAEKTEEAEEIKKIAEKTKQEKAEIEKKFEEQTQKIIDGKVYKYNRTTYQFENSELLDNKYTVNTRRRYATTADLLDQTGNYDESCYLTDGLTSFEYDSGTKEAKSKALKVLGLTGNQVKGYEEYCQRTK